ncbi:MAG: ribose-phosphate pyrophosphokinase [Roseibacillus sp.]|jgi:ribose-phosphate pyrophosphokinase|nr:ribose-phosphate pyrophosphokinase [Roseibacillus sp.]|tara:strand:- start:551 stop:1504 length:954 start_codon:yes stop_codon:yes gene_type:complete
MKLLTGNAHPSLAQGIADQIGTSLADAEVTSFPDGETYVQINENVRRQDVFLIQPTCPPTNQNLMELLIMVDAVRRASAERITAVIPFFGYARQDRKDKPRAPITAKLVANLIEAAGVDRVLTMDLHAAQVQGFFDIPVDHLYAKPVLLKHLRKQRNGSDREITVVSPDVGGVKIARSYADALGAELAIVAKQRISATVVEAMKLIGEVEGRDAIIVDDMTETAGTLCAAAETLKNNGAGRIYAGVSHAVLGDLGCERIMSSDIDEVITTDSTPLPPEACRSKVSTLTVAGLLGEAIQRIHNGKSVSSLFDIEGGSV